MTISSSDTDTKNTAGSTDTSNKIYLVGATSQAANPQTYSDNEVHVTNGILSARGLNITGNEIYFTKGAIISYDVEDGITMNSESGKVSFNQPLYYSRVQSPSSFTIEIPTASDFIVDGKEWDFDVNEDGVYYSGMALATKA